MTGTNAGQVVILIDALHCIEYFGTVLIDHRLYMSAFFV